MTPTYGFFHDVLCNPALNGNHQVARADAVATYRIEPYVAAVHAHAHDAAQHARRGGRFRYAGSAGWRHRWLAESLLAKAWTGFEMDDRFARPLGRVRRRLRVPSRLALMTGGQECSLQ